MIIGYASGVFDLFHIGHLNILRRSSLMCDRLIAGVTSDPEVDRLKGRPAAQTQEERMEIVGSLKYVSEVYLDRHAIDKTLAWEDLGFHVIFKGSDWVGTEKGRALEAAMAQRGVRVQTLPYTRSTSSTLLRSTIEEVRTLG